MKLIKTFAFVAMLATLASCGMLRNKSKHSQELKIKESAEIRATSNESSGSKSTVKEKEIDKGVIITERETTTKTTREGKRGKIIINKGDLNHGENMLMDAELMVNAVLDTLNKTLTLEIDVPDEITETKVKEKITENKDQDKERDSNTQDSSKNKVAVQAQQNRNEAQQMDESDSSPNVWAILMNNIGWAIGFLVILIGVCWWFFGFRRNKPNK